MADPVDPTAAAYVCFKALTDFTERGKVLLDLAEKKSGEGSVQDFIRTILIEDQRCLLGLIAAGASLYRSLSVKRKKDAEELWGRNDRCAVLRDAVQNLQQLEERWDAFLQRLDQEFQLTAKIMDEDPQSKWVPAETPLLNARTGERVTLGKYLRRGKKTLLVLIRQFSCLLCRLHLRDLERNQGSLDAAGVEVVVVSFGCQEGASHWLQETQCHYDVLLDPERKLYAAFGLGASVKKVLNFGNMLLYAEHVANDTEFPRGLPSIQDDMFQLGGDFVLDEHGGVLFSHRCQSPIDRPSVDAILSAPRGRRM